MEEFGPLEQLFAFLVVLYLVECVRWVGRGSRVLRSVVPGSWALDCPWEPAPQWRRALAWTAPWPPLGALYVMDALPVGPGPLGVTVGVNTTGRWTRPSASTVHIPWDELQRLRVRDLELTLDGRVISVLGTRRMAVALASLFRSMAAVKPSKRQALLEAFLSRRFDIDEVRTRRKRWRRWGWPLIVSANLLFVGLFASVCAVLFTSLAEHWPYIALGMSFLWSLTALSFTLAMVRVLPREVHPPLFRRVITFLSPMSLVRSADDLRAELFGDFEPATVAAVFEHPRSLSRSLRAQLAEWRWPLVTEDGDAPPAAITDDAWLRERLMHGAGTILKARGLGEEALMFGEISPDGGSHAFCPRCLSQYVQAEGACTNCPGVALQRFPDTGQGYVLGTRK